MFKEHKRPRAVKKLVITALLAGLAYVLNSFVYFPSMAPFQHFVDVIAGVFLGPWYGALSALLCGGLRMLSGRTIQAVSGAVFGPILVGFLYQRTKSLSLAFLGEVLGTAILGAGSSYWLMVIFYGLKPSHWYYFIPYYLPAALVGAGMGVAVLLVLQRNHLLAKFQRDLN